MRGSTNSYDFVRFWLETVSSGFVNEFKWTEPVDTSAMRTLVSDRSIPTLHRIRYRDRRIAVRDGNRQRRLRVCCDIFERFRLPNGPSVTQSLALVDGLTVVRGDKFQVAGLVPTYRYAGPDWNVIDRSGPPLPGHALARFRDTVSAIVHGAQGTRDGSANSQFDGSTELSPSEPQQKRPARPEPDRGPVTADRFSDVFLSRDAIAQAIDNAMTSHAPLASGIEREIFERPELVINFPGAANSSELSVSVFEVVARALIIARYPAVALELHGAFTDWLETLNNLDIGLHTLVLSELAQSVYDHCRRHADHGETTGVLQGLDRLMDRLIEMVEQLFASAQDVDFPIELWPDKDRNALASAFDRLSELETTSPQRDRQLLRAGAIVRLVAGLPTPDIVDRAVRAALIENSKVFGQLIPRSHRSAVLTEVGAVAVADVRGKRLGEGRRLFGEMFSFVGQASASNSTLGPAGPADGGPPIFNSFQLD